MKKTLTILSIVFAILTLVSCLANNVSVDDLNSINSANPIPEIEITLDPTNPPQSTTSTTAAPVPPSDSYFQVHFIDVGQADSALIICDGKTMLIDGGNVDDSSLLVSYLNKLSLSHIVFEFKDGLELEWVI